MQPLSPAPIQAPISMLEKTPGLLEILLRDVSPEVLDWKPAADRWSITEVLGHLVVIERLYEQRAKRILLEHSPVLLRYQPPPAEDSVARLSLRQHLEEFGALRRAFVFYMHSVASAAAGRTGQHGELGTITLSEMLHELANHDLGHLRQIAELYRARSFYPHAGPFQKYSKPKP